MSAYDAWKLSSPQDDDTEEVRDDVFCDCGRDVEQAIKSGSPQCPYCGSPLDFERNEVSCRLIPRWKPGRDLSHPMWRKQ